MCFLGIQTRKAENYDQSSEPAKSTVSTMVILPAHPKWKGPVPKIIKAKPCLKKVMEDYRSIRWQKRVVNTVVPL